MRSGRSFADIAFGKLEIALYMDAKRGLTIVKFVARHERTVARSLGFAQEAVPDRMPPPQSVMAC